MSQEDYGEQVEIQSPAIGEIKKTRSCLRRTCFSGCGCAVFVVALVLGGVWLLLPPKPQKIKELPADFPTTIPLYKEEDVAEITYLSRARQKRGPETAAYIPKILLAPVLLALDKKEDASWRQFKNIVQSPVREYRDRATITWVHLNPDVDFLDEWYSTELTERHFEIKKEFVSSTMRRITFTHDTTRGTVTIDDPKEDQGTDLIILNVEY